ncbi:hypothetical protein [Alicyclobacillus mengziensis]|uniref:Uncharacterized protein n=1 Tax=Alicyclobacillus mengziensis TaxID=2931921 RepID=A0A9X7Z7K5_9BACL|nr:hypothetical protein [Alicyclobacillus mengziensis]QSO48512.1 hypothetical protein JZ786_05865 [Alicyclobacillus mengziensis]
MKRRNNNSWWIFMVFWAGMSALNSRLLDVPWLFAMLTAEAGVLLVWFAIRLIFSRRKRCTRL